MKFFLLEIYVFRAFPWLSRKLTPLLSSFLFSLPLCPLSSILRPKPFKDILGQLV